MKDLMISIVLMLGLTTAAFATTGKLSIQGHLANGGTPMDGDHTAAFAFFDAPTAGAQLWTETDTIRVASYLFSATLGKNVPIPDNVFTSAGAWLETTVDGTTLTPRIAYYPQPVTGFGVDSLWQTDGTNVWRGRGNVGIATATPTSTLEVNGIASFMDDGAPPDTKAYATLGITRAPSTGNQSYLGLTKQGVIPWAIGLGGETNNLIFGTASPSPARTIPNPLFSINPYTGAVGVGTTAPAYPLDVLDNGPNPLGGIRFMRNAGTEANSYVLLGSNNARGAIFMGNPNPYGVEPGDGAALLHTTGGWQWNNQLNVMGRVGINTNNPSSTLTVGGDVYISGALLVSGTKCREAKTAQYGSLYYNAVESAEAIFTTSGRAKLARGKCHVEVSPKWLAGVTVDARHPLDVSTITFYGPHGDWYVVPGTSGFDLIDPSGSNAPFFWAVQARQKGYEDRYLDQPEPIATK